MKRTGVKRIARLAVSVLAAAFLFLASGPSVQAQNGQVYWVKIYKGIDKPLCPGQTTTLTVAYKLNAGETEKGPPRFSFEASNGEIISPNPTTGGMGTGFVYINFKATEPGVAKIFAMANGSDGSDITTVRIKRFCNYKYNLVVKVHATSRMDSVVFTWEDTFKAEGEFSAAAAGTEPLAPLLPKKNMKATLTIIEQKADNDECNLPATTWSNMEGTGAANVTGVMITNRTWDDVRVIFDSVEMTHTPTFTIPCKHGPLSRTLPLNFSAANWLEKDFPAEGGTKKVWISSMDDGVERLNQSPGTSASYNATLTIESIDE